MHINFLRQEALAPTLTAAGKDGPAIFRAHAFAKAELLFAGALGWLISAFWHRRKWLKRVRNITTHPWVSMSAFRNFLPPGEGGRDADFVALTDYAFHAVEEADVFPVHMDKDETANFAPFVVDALFDTGERFIEVLDNFTDGGSGGADFGKLVGESAQWCWN